LPFSSVLVDQAGDLSRRQGRYDRYGVNRWFTSVAATAHIQPTITFLHMPAMKRVLVVRRPEEPA
jgi:hypothetical protein